jgi:hypothetical protein
VDRADEWPVGPLQPLSHRGLPRQQRHEQRCPGSSGSSAVGDTATAIRAAIVKVAADVAVANEATEEAAGKKEGRQRGCE